MESNAEKLDREPRHGLMDVMMMAGERGEGLTSLRGTVQGRRQSDQLIHKWDEGQGGPAFKSMRVMIRHTAVWTLSYKTNAENSKPSFS